MTQEELKTCLGQLLTDLRGNWAYEYTSRMEIALELCKLIDEATYDVENKVRIELEDGDFDGRIFSGATFYGYESEEGKTDEVKGWLRNNITHPEYCSALQ